MSALVDRIKQWLQKPLHQSSDQEPLKLAVTTNDRIMSSSGSFIPVRPRSRWYPKNSALMPGVTYVRVLDIDYDVVVYLHSQNPGTIYRAHREVFLKLFTSTPPTQGTSDAP